MALVITIVILIILATVAISYVFGENGLITRAQQAKEQTEIASLIERMELAEGSAYIDGKGIIDPDNYFDLLESDGIILSTEEPDVIDNEDGTYQITTEEGYVFEITLLPDKENPTNIEVEYIGKENNLGPRIREIRITGRTTNSVSIEVETRNAEGASYTYSYKEAGTGEWIEAETSENNTCTIGSLEAGKAYEIQVKVETGNGEVTEEIGVTIGELPEGTIKFGETEWLGDGTARITVETSESGYTLQYQKNGTEEGSWTEINNGGTIENLSHGNTVYARLWDGTNGSEHASASIADDTAPEVEIAIGSVTSNSATLNVTASDAQSGLATSGTYKYYLGDELKATNETNSYTFTGLADGTEYTLKVAVTDKAGKTTEKSTTVTTATVPDGTVEGSITFGGTTWNGSVASIKINTSTSYTIEYQVNSASETWTEIANGGTIGNLKYGDTVYARLTDGVNSGEYASASVEDDIAPIVSISTSNLTSNSVKLNVTASDAQSGLATSGTYKYYLGSTLKTTSTTNSYTFTGLTDGTQYTLKVVVTDKAGKTTEKSTTITTATVPDGTVEGSITFGGTTWNGSVASIKVNTNTSYTIEYQVNSASGTWKTIANGGTIGNLKYGDTVYARLTDGSNTGNYASASVEDDIAPIVSISTSNLTSNSVKLTVTASDAQSGLATSGTYKYYLGSTLKTTSTTNSYTFTGLTDGTKYTLKVIVTDKAGKTTEKSTTITTATVPDGTVSGAITFGSTTWSNNKASVKVSTSTSYTIQYQINSTTGTWKTIANGGTIGNLSHGNTVYARLTDGSNAGAHASVDIKDDIAPTVSISTSNITGTSATLTVTASDAQSGLATSGTYKYYLGSTLKTTSTTNSYTFTGLTANTKYTLKVVVTDKAGKTTEKSTTITTYYTIDEKLEEGDYVYYIDKKGETRTCVVLYDNNSGYGIQIITMETVENIELGNGSGSSSSSQDETKFNIAKESYNNAVNTLNTKAEEYLNTTYASGARSVGSVPNNPDYAGDTMYTKTDEWFADFNGEFVNPGTSSNYNYVEDYEQMKDLKIEKIDKGYWFASNLIRSSSTDVEFYVCHLYNYTNGHNINTNYLCRVFNGGVSSYSWKYGLRPVFTLKPGLKITGGSGTETAPYTLGT
mgnify:CR=1 FL=1